MQYVTRNIYFTLETTLINILFILYLSSSLKTAWHIQKEIRACYFLFQHIT